MCGECGWVDTQGLGSEHNSEFSKRKGAKQCQRVLIPSTRRVPHSFLEVQRRFTTAHQNVMPEGQNSQKGLNKI
jgi:hypothetical protein